MTLLWRSLQYVPAHVEKYVGNPRLADADAVVLDLEDSVPLAEKAGARGALAAGIATVAALGPDVLVRINEGDHGDLDLADAVAPGVSALVIPKVRDAAHVRALDARISELEQTRGLAIGAVRLVLLIETAAAFLAMREIAQASSRTLAINLGGEDFAADIGMDCTAETLLGPRQQMVIVAAAAGVLPLGLMGSTTRYDDLTAYRELAERSARFGYVGATCIHPSQIAVLNTAFAPAPDAVAWAQRVVEGSEQALADGRAAFAINGRMIDPPIVARAQRLLERQRQIDNRNQRRSAGVRAVG